VWIWIGSLAFGLQRRNQVSHALFFTLEDKLLCMILNLQHPKNRIKLHAHYKPTSGCMWPSATVKSPVGARDLRPMIFRNSSNKEEEEEEIEIPKS
jgi:hypothetical protein